MQRQTIEDGKVKDRLENYCTLKSVLAILLSKTRRRPSRRIRSRLTGSIWASREPRRHFLSFFKKLFVDSLQLEGFFNLTAHAKSHHQIGQCKSVY